MLYMEDREETVDCSINKLRDTRKKIRLVTKHQTLVVYRSSFPAINLRSAVDTKVHLQSSSRHQRMTCINITGAEL